MNREIPYMFCEFEHKIQEKTEAGFADTALALFQFQYRHNPVYRAFTDNIHTNPRGVRLVEQIPFLPIRFFKTHELQTGSFRPELVFESSGTTRTTSSRHQVKSAALYKKVILENFRQFYGPPSDWCILGLLPSYLERKNASLVYMVEELIRESGHPQSGFYLTDFGKLSGILGELEAKGQKTLLIGVTFALLDFASAHPMPLRHTVLMETGGMKGRREEMTREEVHALLKNAFGVEQVHSEYGMTELLSQAYSYGNGVFRCPPWMRIFLREENDPLEIISAGHSDKANKAQGLVNIIDLANIWSCCFIATDDVGRLYPDGSFSVEGRLDNVDLRGCNLLVAGI